MCTLLVLSIAAIAQKDWEDNAKRAFENSQYFSAVDHYKKAISKQKKSSLKAEYNYKIAECYQKMWDPKNAEVYFQRAINLNYDDPEVYRKIADVQRTSGKYDDALENYKAYQTKVPESFYAKEGIRSCKTARKWEKNPTRWMVQEVTALNSLLDDYSPAYGSTNDVLYFSSSRDGAMGDQMDSKGVPYCDIWESKSDAKGGWKIPVPLETSSEINTEIHEGAATLIGKKEKNVLYFTRCPYVKKQNIGCDIWKVEKGGSDWKKPEKIQGLKDSIVYTVGHPAMSHDGKIMVFAADIPAEGHQGGRDLWITRYDKKKDEWVSPINLGSEINSSGDESFPYIRKDGRLLYSSNGFVGMGGLDIFVAEREAKKWKWGSPKNMQYPINSHGNDFGIIFEVDPKTKKDTERGYFTTNRNPEKRTDIWSFRLMPYEHMLEVILVDSDSKKPIPNATVTLKGGGKSYELSTGSDGKVLFEKLDEKTRYVLENNTYLIVAVADQYLLGKDKITTVGLKENTRFVKQFELKYTDPKIEIDFPEVRYELDQDELMVIKDSIDSKDSLDFLYETLVDNPKIIIQLQAHTDFRGSDKYNLDLSKRRAKSCVDYLISKGIPSSRMIPKGYGERKPYKKNLANGQYVELTERYINSLSTKLDKEHAHQVNRRTTFSVISWDYVPKPGDPGYDSGNP